MGNAVQCCVRRDDDGLQFTATRCDSWHSIPDAEEQWAFFEEVDMGEAALSSSPVNLAGQPPISKLKTWIKLRPDARNLALVPEEHLAAKSLQDGAGSSSPAVAPMTTEDMRYDSKVAGLAEGVRQAWAEMQAHPADDELKRLLDEGFPELDEWTRPETCRRMLRAVQGDEAQASQMLVKAIECRVRDRHLYSTLLCEVTCDIRVIGRDAERRPTVYMCARSQRKSLKDTMPQIFLAFEAAVRLSQADGQVVLIADMHKFHPKHNMDPFAFKELAASFGTVFADRLKLILIVDFSFLAQSIWSACKPLLSERTKKKINFVNESKARDIAREKLSAPTCDRVISAFDINRDRTSTEQDREIHAQRTAICDVPLGAVRHTDEAG